jgi:acetyltransferase-like isoleucine patch superfamily enzyme
MNTLFKMILLRLMGVISFFLMYRWASDLQMGLLWLLRIKSGKHISIGEQFFVQCPKNLKIGSKISIGRRAQIFAYDSIEIGDDFMAAEDLLINCGSHNVSDLKPFMRPIKIGRRVWCGSRVIICSGVTIGDDVVIGAGSVVVQDIPSKCVAVGIPCKVIRELGNERTSIWSHFD